MTIRTFEGLCPRTDAAAFVADSALVLGDVILGVDSSIWYQTVVRGDVHHVRIGRRTNIQDRCVVHVTSGKCPVVVGDEVTVGHGVIVHGCHLGSRVLVGMGALLLDDVEVGDGSVIAAGALLPPGRRYPPGSLVVGSPARVVRPVTGQEAEWIVRSAERYVELARRHAALTGSGAA